MPQKTTVISKIRKQWSTKYTLITNSTKCLLTAVTATPLERHNSTSFRQEVNPLDMWRRSQVIDAGCW